MLYRRVGQTENIIATTSLIYRGLDKGDDTFDVYNELNGNHIGLFSRQYLLNHGFSKSQLSHVRKNGKTKFVKVKENDNIPDTSYY